MAQIDVDFGMAAEARAIGHDREIEPIGDRARLIGKLAAGQRGTVGRGRLLLRQRNRREQKGKGKEQMTHGHPDRKRKRQR